MSQYERQLFEYFSILDRKQKLNPLILGGITASGGGSGSPIGGFIGTLPQTRVSYDLSELATLSTAASGESLLDNLNHIRYRIEALEVASGGGGGTLSIYDDTVLQGVATELDFTTGITATVSAGRATIVAIADPGIDKVLVINGTNAIKSYNANSAGLQSALDNTVTNDKIYIPPGYYIVNPISFTTKRIAMFGSGMYNTYININGAASNRWLVEMTSSNFPNPITLKDMSFEFSSVYDYSGQTTGGFMKLDNTSGTQMENVRIYGSTFIPSQLGTRTFYGLYNQGGHASYYDSEKTVMRNVHIDLTGDAVSDYMDFIGAFVSIDLMNEVHIHVQSYFCNDLLGLEPSVGEIRDCDINVVREEPLGGNGNATGIYLHYSGHRIVDTNIYVYNFTGSLGGTPGEIRGIDDTTGANEITNCSLILEAISETGSDNGTAVRAFYFDSILDNDTIKDTITEFRYKPEAGGGSIGITPIYTYANSANKYVIAINSNFFVTDVNGNVVDVDLSNYDVTPGYIYLNSVGLGNIIHQHGGIRVGGLSNYFNVDSGGNLTVNGTAVPTLIAKDTLWQVKGDLVVGTGDNTASRLPVANNGYVLIGDSTTSTGLKWDKSFDLLANSNWQAKGDIVVASGAGVAGILPVGSDGQILVSDPTELLGVKWEYVTASGIYSSGLATDILWDNKGDLVVGTGNDAATVLGSGVEGSHLVVDGTTSTGLIWIIDPIATPGGRLTLTSGTPITTSDVTGATHVYYTPYLHNGIQLWTGAYWKWFTFPEIDINLAGYTASTPYDFFAYINSGVAAIETLIWVNATTRTVAVERQDGRLVKYGDKTRFYLGSAYINSSGGQVNDNLTNRYLYNYYNNKMRSLYKSDATAHNYTTAAWQSWNASTANRVSYMIGQVEEPFEVSITGRINPSADDVIGYIGIGYDITNNTLTGFAPRWQVNQEGRITGAAYEMDTAPGFHFLQAVEYGATTTNFGDFQLRAIIKG
jgi:hypothetical protein